MLKRHFSVKSSRSKIGKGGYNLFTHNCEHFAIWCKTGLNESTQLSIEGIAVRFLRSKLGLLRYIADEIWRVEAVY